MNYKIYIFENPGQLAQKLARDFGDYVSVELKNNAKLNIVLSGGSTPREFLELLSKKPYRNGIAWKRIHFFWTDERCVPPDHVESNFKMAYDALLSHLEIPEINIHRIKGENPPVEEVVGYAREIQENVSVDAEGIPCFDWIFLGVGEDGHTASLFPNDDVLTEKSSYCVLTNNPYTGQKRISLSLPLINNSRRVTFLVVGEEKSFAVKEIIESETGRLSYPASMVNPGHCSPEFYIDSSAARYIQGICTLSENDES